MSRLGTPTGHQRRGHAKGGADTWRNYPDTGQRSPYAKTPAPLCPESWWINLTREQLAERIAHRRFQCRWSDLGGVVE